VKKLNNCIRQFFIH